MTYTFTADTWTIMGCRWTRHLPVFRGQRRRASFQFKQWCLFLIRYLGLRICTWSHGGGEMLSTPLCRRQWENCSCPPPAATLRENRPCIPPGQHSPQVVGRAVPTTPLSRQCGWVKDASLPFTPHRLSQMREPTVLLTNCRTQESWPSSLTQ